MNSYIYQVRVMFFVYLLVALVSFSGCHRTLPASKENRKANGSEQSSLVKPFRVLVIIGDQWKDPLSYHIDSRRVDGTDFIDVITMLKIWGIPFDVLRLDEQRLQINRFLDGEARPNYGCMIWMADPDKLSGYSANYETVKMAVEKYGISMIALFDYIRTKPIAEMIDVEWQAIPDNNTVKNRNHLILTGRHFITADTTDSLPADMFVEIRCVPGDSASVLGTVGGLPQLIARDISHDTKVVWIGGGKDSFRKYPAMRKIFRKALVHAIGYGIFNDNFENGYIFIMDDVGCSEHAYSLRWHYPTPDRETLVKCLIEPLEKHGLIMVQNITPGYANPLTNMIESPWTVEPFRDIFGNWQDYGSTKEGLDEGLRRGVFEIQAHRAWSHMNWDLDSPPGPWWSSAVDGEMNVVDWYNEVVDVRREASPVPSNDLLFIYRTGIDAIKKSFGVVPLAAEVRPVAELREGTHGGDDNGRVAAIAGLGISRECYVGIDHTIEFSMMMPEQFTCHDLDLTAQTNSPADQTEAGWDKLAEMTTEQLVASKIAGGRRVNLRDSLNWIYAHKHQKWMGFNECCAYLHTQISNTKGSKPGLEFSYDDHYCKYFENKASRWTFETSDDFRNAVGSKSWLFIDGKKVKKPMTDRQILEIPSGLGKHTLHIAGMP